MPDRFYDGQRGPDIRRELNNLEAVFDDAIANAKGPQGWSPELAVVADGTRRVFQVIDWIGGEGDKPTDLGYIGVVGIVPNIVDAIDVRGTQGIQGIQGAQGVKGDTGDAGTNGTNGTNGLDGTDGLDGENGWSPVLSNIIDGARAVQQVTDWVGGTGTKPVTGKYIGATGLVDDIADAVNIRGASGAGTGDVMGPASSANNAVVLFDGTTGKLLKDGGLLGTAAFEDITDFASAAEGDLAMTAVQPGDLNLVATSGDYDDLTNKPTIPAAQQQTDWTATSGITSIANKPAVIAAGSDAAAARTAIGAGTSNLTLGTTAGTALEGNTVILADAPSDGKTYGRKDAAWVESLKLGTTSTTALAGDTVIPSGGNASLNVGYMNIPQNSQSAAYTCVLADAGKHILHPAADTTARTFTIPANSSVAYPIGTAITFVNQNGTGGIVTIAITTDTMRLAGAGTTGSRTLARNGTATALKITATEWIISGGGLT